MLAFLFSGPNLGLPLAGRFPRQLPQLRREALRQPGVVLQDERQRRGAPRRLEGSASTRRGAQGASGKPGLDSIK